MRIIKYINPCFPDKDWYRCNIKNETYSSPHRENVELWRDDRMINSEYYKELDKQSIKKNQENLEKKISSNKE